MVDVGHLALVGFDFAKFVLCGEYLELSVDAPKLRRDNLKVRVFDTLGAASSQLVLSHKREP
jgi:hypothetical protein